MSLLSYSSTTIISSIQIEDDALKIEINLKKKNFNFFPCTISITFFDDKSGKRKVFVGKFPYLRSTINFSDIDSKRSKTRGGIKRNRLSHTLKVPLNSLPQFSSLFITLESYFSFFHETDWAHLESNFHDYPKKEKKKFATIIPCYNAIQFCEKVIHETLEYSEEIIFVNDGSTDGTSEVVEKLASQNKRIHLIGWEKNRGKGYAIFEGFKYALENGFSAVITIDADGQHMPEDIPNIARLIEEGTDLVIGSRKTKLMPFKNRFANETIAFLLRLIYPNAPLDTQSGSRGFSISLMKDIVSKNLKGRYEMEFKCLLLALYKRFKIKPYSIPTVYIDKNKSSHYGAVRDSFLILKTYFWHLILKTTKL